MNSYKGLFDLSGRIALVTGASQGIGREIALGFAAFGADVTAVSRNGDALNTLSGEIESFGRNCLTITADLRAANLREKVVRQAVARFGRIDILANIAGTFVEKRAVDVEEEDWDMVLDTNLKALFFLCRDVGRLMLAQKYGRIINMSSTYSIVGRSGRVSYGASKAAISNLTKTLALEWSGSGVNVNALAPGPIETPGRAKRFADPAIRAATIGKIPIARLGQASDIVGPAVFLASGASEFVTGETLLVDGGFCAQ